MTGILSRPAVRDSPRSHFTPKDFSIAPRLILPRIVGSIGAIVSQKLVVVEPDHARGKREDTRRTPDPQIHNETQKPDGKATIQAVLRRGCIGGSGCLAIALGAAATGKYCNSPGESVG